MKSIIECEATFENNLDMEVKVTQKQLSRDHGKFYQWIRRRRIRSNAVCPMKMTSWGSWLID